MSTSKPMVTPQPQPPPAVGTPVGGPLVPVERVHLTEQFYATRPTRLTLFMRTFFLWQLWRFVWINLKMVRIIFRNHHSH